MIPFKDDIGLARTPVITIALILASVVAYVLAAVHGGSLIGGPSGQTVVRYGAIPYEFSHWGQHCALGLAGFEQAVLCTGQHGVIGSAGPQPATWETAFTAMFLHANILHLAVNMVFLGVFGASVEDRVGRLAFLGFYLLGGIVALALQVLVAPGSATPTLGASGAIAAVLGAYIVLYPRAKIRTLVVAIFRFTFVELAAWVGGGGVVRARRDPRSGRAVDGVRRRRRRRLLRTLGRRRVRSARRARTPRTRPDARAVGQVAA